MYHWTYSWKKAKGGGSPNGSNIYEIITGKGENNKHCSINQIGLDIHSLDLTRLTKSKIQI